jgi:16S rRNA (adenine1518-N6/adenine1519-N6)-dimethyltransferase
VTRPAVAPKKSLGQHFLHDAQVLAKIASLARPPAGSGIVEVGPGTGNLTAHLLDQLPRDGGGQAPLWLVEVDRRVPEVLAERFGACFGLLMGDAATIDWTALLAEPRLGPAPVVVGNLPYYAALPIVFALVDLPQPPSAIVVMVQREVADRMVAAPSTADRGQVSVKLQLRAEVKTAFKVGRGAFQPPPQVESAVVVIRPRTHPLWPLPPWPQASAWITDAFAMRRKTLVNSMQLSGRDGAAVRTALQEAGLDPAVRAEAIDNATWAALLRRLVGEPSAT